MRSRFATERGVTLIELLVALTVLTIGILGTMVGFSASQRLSLVSERHAAMAHVAQREIERIEGIAYGNVAMSATPGPHSSDAANPDYYLVDGSPPSFTWDRTNGYTEKIDSPQDGSGQVVPVQNWSEGLLSGQVFDFITWTADPKCAPGCPASNDYKRITVAVTMGGGLRPNPVYVSSVIADPQAMPAGGISNGDSGNPLADPSTYCRDANGNHVVCTSPSQSGDANTFYFHDWPATSGANVQPPTSDHETHATVGKLAALNCSTKQSDIGTGSQIAGCPTPDLMDGNPPAGDGTTPVWHYSSELGSTGYTGGRLLQPTCVNSTGCGTGVPTDCNSGAWSTSLVNTQSEFWVTAPLSASTTLNGAGGISLFTQTPLDAGGAATSAVVSFCVEIYDVPPSGSAGSLADLYAWPPVDLGGAGDVPEIVNGGNWPTSPNQVSFVFNFRGSNPAITVPAGDRLGARIWMKAETNVPIAVLYDNPLYPSQMQLNTQ